MTHTFAFTKLLVADLGASEQFYTSVFGFEVAGRVAADVAGRPIDEIMLRSSAPAAGSLILFRFRDVVGPTTEEVMLGFMVADVDRAVAEVVAAGGSLVDEPHDVAEMRVRVGIVADPEGHLIELVHRLPA